MRQIQIQLPADRAADLVEVARELSASTITRVHGHDGHGADVELVVVTVPNRAVGDLLDAAQEMGRIEASMVGAGAFGFEPPAGRAPQEQLDVTPRSAFEVVLAGRQSTGGWAGFLTYAAMAGVVVWLGLFTETVYLLTGSMLIAPFAGPAMNTAIGISSGRLSLLRHSVVRYLVGILVTAGVSALLTLVSGQTHVTGLMTSVMTITFAAVLLPLAAGVAGATFLAQSEHSSLISGAAVGVLVAASLAPPAGGIGMALALGRIDLALHGAFLVALQLTGITASAVGVLCLYGVRPGAARFGGRQGWLLAVGSAAAVVGTIALVGVQAASAPSLTQGSAARDAVEVVDRVLAARDDALMLSVEPTVASADTDGPPRVLLDVVVERRADAPPAPELREQLEARIVGALDARLDPIISHVAITVHDAR